VPMYGAQINFGDLTPYFTFARNTLPPLHRRWAGPILVVLETSWEREASVATCTLSKYIRKRIPYVNVIFWQAKLARGSPGNPVHVPCTCLPSVACMCEVYYGLEAYL
jgi:hypothetical protein